jgi:hypothetical protein
MERSSYSYKDQANSCLVSKRTGPFELVFEWLRVHYYPESSSLDSILDLHHPDALKLSDSWLGLLKGEKTM